MSTVRWNLKEALRQTSGLTNRNPIRQSGLGKVAKQTEALNYPEIRFVNEAGRWKERLRSYLGRSHGRVERVKKPG